MLPTVQSAPTIESLPALVERAASHLASAKDSAEVLEARDMAGVAYTAAKVAARLAKAKGAFDDVIVKVWRAQADALQIEAMANRRIADEYDAAQARGEVGKRGDYGAVNSKTEVTPPTAADIGLNTKTIHEARQIRDAEETYPGIVRRVLDTAIEAGEEPTRATLRRATSKRRPRPTAVGKQLANLRKAWREACPAVREHFLTEVTERVAA